MFETLLMTRSSLFVLNMQIKWSKVTRLAKGFYVSFEAHTSHLFRPFVQDGRAGQRKQPFRCEKFFLVLHSIPSGWKAVSGSLASCHKLLALCCASLMCLSSKHEISEKQKPQFLIVSSVSFFMISIYFFGKFLLTWSTCLLLGSKNGKKHFGKKLNPNSKMCMFLQMHLTKNACQAVVELSCQTKMSRSDVVFVTCFFAKLPQQGTAVQVLSSTKHWCCEGLQPATLQPCYRHSSRGQ